MRGTESADSKDRNLPLDVMAGSFTGLLVDLFSMLATVECQELFDTLYKVYPTPADAKRCFEMAHYRYVDWCQCLLDGATIVSRIQNTTFFPSEPPMEEFQHQLEEASQRYGYDRFTDARSRPQYHNERAEVLQFCRTKCSVSTSHISFLEQLHKRLQEACAPFQFQLQLLIAQVSNCLHYDWASKGSGYAHRERGRDHDLNKSLLASNDIGSSLQALKNMWKFSVPPEHVLDLLKSVQGQVSPQDSDVMCDVLISVLDCKPSLYLRALELIYKVSSTPGHMLQAVNVVISCGSGKAQSSNECWPAFIQCAEALGKAYNRHKALGVAEEELLKLRVKAVDLLQQARSIPPTIILPEQETVHKACPTRVNVKTVTQVVCDSGQDALAGLLDLVVKLPGDCIMVQLRRMKQLCSYYFKDSCPSNPLQESPFKETVMTLLEKRKNLIKTLAGSRGETRKMREFVSDLKAGYQFFGDEAAFATFEKELATIFHNADRQASRRGHRQMPWGMVYGGDDVGENLQQDILIRQLLALARAQQMPYFW